jgi:hypothetical protein
MPPTTMSVAAVKPSVATAVAATMTATMASAPMTPTAGVCDRRKGERASS